MKKVLRLFTDGAARGNPGPAGAGIVIEDEQGTRLRGLHRWLGHKTNNEAEYLALIDGLRAVAEWHPDELDVYLDSKLVVEQVKGGYRVKKAALQALNKQAMDLIQGFPEWKIAHVEREKNKGADALANRAIDDHVKNSTAPG